MTKAYLQMVGRMAYVWGYAMVNSHNRRAGFAYVTGQNGNVTGWNGGTIPMAPIGYNAICEVTAGSTTLPSWPGTRLH